jgi:hypothetical protein
LSVSSSGDPGAADANGGDATSATSIVGTGWHMLAYTYSGASGVASNGSLYVDGALKAHDTVTQPSGNNYDVWIGGSPDYGTSRLLPGSIAQLAIFTNALSASQILTLYNASQVSPPVTLNAVAVSGSLRFSWLQGTLLQSTNLSGAWTTNPATSPCIILTTNPAMFFKVRVN